VTIRQQIRRAAGLAFRFEPLRQWRIRQFDHWFRRRHPIDVQYNMRTGGAISSEILYRSARAAADRNFYVGSQPVVVRGSLALVPDPHRTVLLDLGCGKGRVLAVASEIGFREIVGVELSPSVAAIARENIANVRRKFPGRSPMRVITGDAVEFPLPDAPLAIFLFHPFGAASMRRLIARIETALEARSQPITVVYYNPVCGLLFDASPALVRAHALTIPYDDFELRGSGPRPHSTVVLWQDRRHAAGEPPPQARRPIVVLDSMTAALEPLASPVDAR
jgi:SAM-dependent methyltransferase